MAEQRCLRVGAAVGLLVCGSALVLWGYSTNQAASSKFLVPTPANAEGLIDLAADAPANDTADDAPANDTDASVPEEDKKMKESGKKGIFQMVRHDFPSEAPEGEAESPAEEKTEDLLTVKKGDLVYHFGEIDHDNGWVWATMSLGDDKDKTGWVPKWALEDQTATSTSAP
mmetsp:Transcript_71439/g.201697  ORF Transcript_71439/g.201697 Transcript_71439/m.201697 type:complete len:171 (-) Transcript_71439:114-626(-)